MNKTVDSLSRFGIWSLPNNLGFLLFTPSDFMTSTYSMIPVFTVCSQWRNKSGKVLSTRKWILILWSVPLLHLYFKLYKSIYCTFQASFSMLWNSLLTKKSRRLQDTKPPKPLIFKMAHDIFFFWKNFCQYRKTCTGLKRKIHSFLGTGLSIDHEHCSPHQSNLGSHKSLLTTTAGSKK